MDPSTHPSASDSQSPRLLPDNFVQEAAATARRIQEVLRARLSAKEYEFTGYQLKRAPLRCNEEPRVYEEHRFQADLRDGSWLVLEVASAHVCLADTIRQPVRYYRQKDNEKLSYTEGCLAQWPAFAKQFCDYYQRHKERRLFRRLDP